MLTQEILEENHCFDIPQGTLNNEIATLVADIEMKPGFNKDQTFDPERHIIFNDDIFEKTKKYSLSELGIKKTHCQPLLDLAGTNPFPFFSEEATDLILWEAFHNRDIVMDFGRLTRYGRGTSGGRDLQLGGFINKTSFTRSALTHPKTKQILNSIAGMNIKMPHAFSMGNINASFAPIIDGQLQTESASEIKEMKKKQDLQGNEIPSTVNWHYDSPPLVMVLMLAAPETMVGGETAIRTGDESVYRIPNPKVGYATFLQGRVVKHIATKPLNSCNRISFVLDFIPEDPEAHDSSVCTSQRPLSVSTYTNDKFYPNWVNYRFERMEQRLALFRSRLIKAYNIGQKFDQSKVIDFCKEIEKYLRGTWEEFELVNDEPFPPKLFSIPYSQL